MASSISAHEAFIANWVCTAFTLTILLARLGSIHYQLGRPDASSYIIIFSIAVLVTRVICNYYVLKYGTIGGVRSDIADGEPTPNVATIELARTGSQLTLVARVLVTTFYWLMCVLLLLVYRRILADIAWVRKAIIFTWVVIATTWLAVVLTTFLECHPLTLFWRLHLASGQGACTKAYAQLLVQCISNIIIDLLLMTISFPILRAQLLTFPRNLQLGVMFVLGTFCIIVTCVRIYYTYQSSSAQNARSFWASIQALVAAFVANAPSIYGATIVKRRKKGTTAGISETGTMTGDEMTVVENEKLVEHGGHTTVPGVGPYPPVSSAKGKGKAKVVEQEGEPF